jgi:hypothetical protein
MNCSREDLVFSDYDWNEERSGNRPPHESVFNRRDGHQMLELLNSCSSEWDKEKSNNFFVNLEKVVRQIVPSRAKTIRDVRNWIETHTPRL